MYFFTTSQGYTLYMGKDKFENEDLIKYGLPEDVWFHVDGLSSAHVYLRQKEGDSFLLDQLDPALVNECCQLVKDNSIEGCKLASCPVVRSR
jgi:predicted ribosome quality control (RQC) complex YloA/Tae2 family protein